MSPSSPPITFIGAGQMARSLLSGLLNADYPREVLSAGDPAAPAQAWLTAQGINTTFNSDAPVVVLAVKPQLLAAISREYAAQFAIQQPLIISIAAGIQIADLRRWLNYNASIVRAMPNTPAKIACGITGLYAGDGVNETQRTWAEQLFRPVGQVLWCTAESQLDAVTAISGSGPAYFFLFMEALVEAAKTLDLPKEIAEQLVYATAHGAVQLAQHDAVDLATLRHQVTSPGGTTEQAIATFQHQGFAALVTRAVHAAHRRAGELSRDLGQQP